MQRRDFRFKQGRMEIEDWELVPAEIVQTPKEPQFSDWLEVILESIALEDVLSPNKENKGDELSYAEISKLKAVFQTAQVSLNPGKKRKRKQKLDLVKDGEDEHSTLNSVPKRFRKNVVKRVLNRRVKKRC